VPKDPENASTGTDDYQVNNESHVPVLCFAKTYWLKQRRIFYSIPKSCMNAFKMFKRCEMFDGEGKYIPKSESTEEQQIQRKSWGDGIATPP